MQDDRVTVVAHAICGFERTCRHPLCDCQHPLGVARRILAALDAHHPAIKPRPCAPSPDAALGAAAARWAKSEIDPDRLAVARALAARFGCSGA